MIVITGLLLQFNLWAQFPPVTLNVETAGTLSTIILSASKYQITDLTLTGYLNGDDIGFIRDMAGRSFTGGITNGQLVNLNLAGVNIVSGGGYYLYYSGSGYLYTINNSISNYMFTGCSLKNIILPNSVTSIGQCALYKCSNLTSVTIGNSVTSIGTSAFQNCSELANVTIPNNKVKRIAEYENK